VLLADDARQAAITRGAGDAESTRIYAESFGRDQQFFAFWRSLQAYQRALGDGSSTMVLSPEGDFFRFFNNMRGVIEPRAGGAPGPAPSREPAPPGGVGPGPATPPPAPPGARTEVPSTTQ